MRKLRKMQKRAHQKTVETTFKPFKDAPTIRDDEIVLKEKIGEGAFATVWRGTCRGCRVAVKVPKLKQGQALDAKKLETFNSEVKVMSKLYHPRIALFMGAHIDPKNIKIVSELLEDFSKILMNKKKVQGFTLYERTIYAVQAVEGMNWLHGANIIHCDFKPSNLLWDKQTKSVKVCDFGMSQLIETEDILTSTSTKGTPLYLAPEVIERKGVTKKADVYSFGISLYQFVTRKEPYPTYTNLRSLLTDVTREENPIRPELPKQENRCPASFRKLAEQCWDPNPDKRPTFARILQKFDNILIDCVTLDPLARMFWKANFISSDDGVITQVPWDIFLAKWVEFFNDGEELDPELPATRGFKKLLCKTVNGEEVVKLKVFGDIIGWFPPLTPPGTDQSENWLSKVTDLLSKPWFWGNASKQKAHESLCTQSEGTFLIRFSSCPPDYTLSYVRNKKVTHTRISHSYSGSTFQRFDSLQKFVDAVVKSGKINSVCPGNPFDVIFEGQWHEGAGYSGNILDDEEDSDVLDI